MSALLEGLGKGIETGFAQRLKQRQEAFDKYRLQLQERGVELQEERLKEEREQRLKEARERAIDKQVEALENAIDKESERAKWLENKGYVDAAEQVLKKINNYRNQITKLRGLTPMETEEMKLTPPPEPEPPTGLKLTRWEKTPEGRTREIYEAEEVPEELTPYQKEMLDLRRKAIEQAEWGRRLNTVSNLVNRLLTTGKLSEGERKTYKRLSDELGELLGIEGIELERNPGFFQRILNFILSPFRKREEVEEETELTPAEETIGEGMGGLEGITIE